MASAARPGSLGLNLGGVDHRTDDSRRSGIERLRKGVQGV